MVSPGAVSFGSAMPREKPSPSGQLSRTLISPWTLSYFEHALFGVSATGIAPAASAGSSRVSCTVRNVPLRSWINMVQPGLRLRGCSGGKTKVSPESLPSGIKIRYRRRQVMMWASKCVGGIECTRNYSRFSKNGITARTLCNQWANPGRSLQFPSSSRTRRRSGRVCHRSRLAEESLDVLVGPHGFRGREGAGRKKESAQNAKLSRALSGEPQSPRFCSGVAGLVGTSTTMHVRAFSTCSAPELTCSLIESPRSIKKTGGSHNDREF